MGAGDSRYCGCEDTPFNGMFCTPVMGKNGNEGASRKTNRRASRLRKKTSWFQNGFKFVDNEKQDSDELIKEVSTLKANSAAKEDLPLKADFPLQADSTLNVDSTQEEQQDKTLSVKPNTDTGNSSGSFRQRTTVEVEGWTAADIRALKRAVDDVSAMRKIKPPNFAAIQVIHRTSIHTPNHKSTVKWKTRITSVCLR